MSDMVTPCPYLEPSSILRVVVRHVALDERLVLAQSVFGFWSFYFLTSILLAKK